MKAIIRTFFILMIALVETVSAPAAIDLVTVPDRDFVQLTIYNSVDITMVKERRTLTFKKGLNTLQFAWAGTLIDATSLRISFRTQKDKLELSDTSYPPGRNDALQWNIISKMEGPAEIEINYFTSGISWKADYTALTNPAEDRMDLSGFVQVVNNSGEDYPNAQVRLVVGTIQLVESIAQLAGGSWRYQDLEEGEKEVVRNQFRKKVKAAEVMKTKGGRGYSKAEEADDEDYVADKKEITKEGLSEYFLFTIEGKETIPNGWKKRLNSITAENIPVQVIYRFSEKLGHAKAHKFYEFKNNKLNEDKNQLGSAPLPDGLVQIFSRRADKSIGYMGSYAMPYIAIGDKVKMDAGEFDDILIKTVTKDYKRTRIKIETAWNKDKVIKGYFEEFYYETTVENTLNKPVKVEVERVFSGKYELKNYDFKMERVDNNTLKFFPEVSSGSKKVYKYRVDVEHKG